MSHFTVMVIGDNPEEQLIPFQENDGGNVSGKYLEFNNEEEEYKKQYKNETMDEFYCSSSSSWGMEVNEENYDKIKLLKVGEYITLNLNDTTHNFFEEGKKYKTYYTPVHKYPEGLHIRIECTDIIDTKSVDKTYCSKGKIKVKRIYPPKKVKLKDYYDTFEDFMKNYAGYDKKDKETGKYGYWQNPNSKWDWYQLGGRWSGILKLKEGKNGKQGEGSLVASNTPGIDQAKKGDIDFELIKKEAKEKAIERWDKFESDLKGEPLPPVWEEFIKKCNKEDQEAIDKLREEYQEIPGVTNLNDYWGFQDFLVGKEKYIENYVKDCFMPFALIKDGKWYEKGEMCWFGIVADEKEDDKWRDEFSKLIEGLSDDTLISMYDCHI